MINNFLTFGNNNNNSNLNENLNKENKFKKQLNLIFNNFNNFIDLKKSNKEINKKPNLNKSFRTKSIKKKNYFKTDLYNPIRKSTIMPVLYLNPYLLKPKYINNKKFNFLI